MSVFSEIQRINAAKEILLEKGKELDICSDGDRIDDIARAFQTIKPVEEPTPYDGDYVVTPRFEDQILETEGMKMQENITVKKIPVNKVTNPSGGYTITIGG